jgi:PIN domain nuclease of toxin-antitoxin system
MRLLLDTHAFLWAVTDDPALSKPARERILEADKPDATRRSPARG